MIASGPPRVPAADPVGQCEFEPDAFKPVERSSMRPNAPVTMDAFKRSLRAQAGVLATQAPIRETKTCYTPQEGDRIVSTNHAPW
jgi:hypothetical protein